MGSPSQKAENVDMLCAHSWHTRWLRLSLFSVNSSEKDWKMILRQSPLRMSSDPKLQNFSWLTVSFQVTSHFTEDFLFNAAISRLMGLTNTLSVSMPSGTLKYKCHIYHAWKSIFFLPLLVCSECSSQGGAAQCGVWRSFGCSGIDDSTHGPSPGFWTVGRLVTFRLFTHNKQCIQTLGEHTLPSQHREVVSVCCYITSAL